jgi:hypothetical protein
MHSLLWCDASWMCCVYEVSGIRWVHPQQDLQRHALQFDAFVARRQELPLPEPAIQRRLASLIVGNRKTSPSPSAAAMFPSDPPSPLPQTHRALLWKKSASNFNFNAMKRVLLLFINSVKLRLLFKRHTSKPS